MTIINIVGNSKLYSTLRFFKRMALELPRIFAFYLYDFVDYVANSASIVGNNNKETHLSAITVYAHNIEKGLSLPSPRPGFGEKNLGLLLRATQSYIAAYGVDDAIARVQGVLRAYVEFSNDVGVADYPFRTDIEQILATPTENSRGGTKLLKKADLQRLIEPVSEDFFTSRSSVRIFENEVVDLDKVARAIKIAQKSPSVCNRQSGYVYVLTKRDDIDRALALQAGARGFGQNVPMVLVITTRTRNFFGTERNQRWVDGGLFAMSLILALHREGLGTCCLNWSKTGRIDRELKKQLAIEKDRSVIFLLAVGEIPERLNVARSEKRALSEMFEVR